MEGSKRGKNVICTFKGDLFPIDWEGISNVHVGGTLAPSSHGGGKRKKESDNDGTVSGVFGGGVWGG